MHAEQHHRPFRVDYSQEIRRPISSFFTELLSVFKENHQTVELDIAGVLRDVLKQCEQMDFESALFLGLKRFALDLWALQQEMVGRRHTQEVTTLLHVIQDDIVAQNKLYPKGIDLETMYAQSLEQISDEKLARYKRETDQFSALLIHCAPLIKKVHDIFSKKKEESHEQELLDLGFTYHDIPITPSLLATIPSLSEKIHTMEDFYQITRGKKTVRVLMAPDHLLTLSPPHWLHNKGKTTFWWDSRLIVFPDTGETALIQNAIFSATPLAGSLDFLSFGQTQERIFHSEEKLMQFITVVRGHATIHPSVLLDFIVDQVDLFTDAQKIDPNVQDGTLDVEPYVKAVEKILRFEYKRAQEEPGILSKFNEQMVLFKDLLQHKVARLNPDGLEELVTAYKQGSLTKQFALQVDPGFSMKIDMSALDCTIGTAFNGIQNMSGLSMDQMFVAIDARFGVGAGEFLHKMSKNGITTSGQLAEFCTRFGLNEKRFHTGKCRTPGCQSTYVGECSVCPACEVMDNFGLHQGWNMQEGSIARTEDIDPLDWVNAVQGPPIGAGAFVASFATPDILSQAA